MRKYLILMLVVGVGAFRHASASNYATNGSFEEAAIGSYPNETLPGWTEVVLGGNGHVWWAGGPAPLPDGIHGGAIEYNVGESVGMYQEILIPQGTVLTGFMYNECSAAQHAAGCQTYTRFFNIGAAESWYGGASPVMADFQSTSNAVLVSDRVPGSADWQKQAVGSFVSRGKVVLTYAGEGGYSYPRTDHWSVDDWTGPEYVANGSFEETNGAYNVDLNWPGWTYVPIAGTSKTWQPQGPAPLPDGSYAGGAEVSYAGAATAGLYQELYIPSGTLLTAFFHDECSSDNHHASCKTYARVFNLDATQSWYSGSAPTWAEFTSTTDSVLSSDRDAGSATAWLKHEVGMFTSKGKIALTWAVESPSGYSYPRTDYWSVQKAFYEGSLFQVE